jgi:cyclic pyranopterin phosphate synthase
MPEHEVAFVDRSEILSFEEIERFARIVVPLGIDKIRLTGGEPLVRKDLHILVRRLAAIPGVNDLALTTNGVLLAAQAEDLYRAGLRRLNVHLDTLDRERFLEITRRDELHRVLDGIHAARQAGFPSIKINVVAVKGLIEPDVVPLARFGRQFGLEIRYIEFMPLDAQGLWQFDRVLTAAEILSVLEREIGPLDLVPGADPRAPSLDYRFRDGSGRIGFIASVTQPFCLNCNRIRLTADGMLRNCLFAREETDLKSILRSGAGDGDVEAAVRAALARKWLGHEINRAGFVPPPRPMYSIGG